MSKQSRVTSRCDVAHCGRENLHHFLPILLWRHALSSSIMTLCTDPSILNDRVDMKAIHLKDWTPSCHSIVCSRHFNEEDFVTSTRDSNDWRKRKRDMNFQWGYTWRGRQSPTSIFSVLTSYLSKKKVANLSKIKKNLSTARLEAENLRKQKAIDSLLISTLVKSFDELQQEDELWNSAKE